MDIWNLSEALTVKDLSTDSFEKRETRPTTDVSSEPQTVTLFMQDKQSYHLLSEAYLEIEFTVTKTDTATPLTESDRAFLPDACALISQAKLEVNQTSVSEVDGVGHVHHLTQLVSQSAEYAKSIASNAFYYPMRARDAVGYQTQVSQLGTRSGDTVLPVLVGTSETVFLTQTNATNAGVPNVDNQIRPVPFADHMSPIVRSFTVGTSATGVGTYDSSILHNPDYDENFVAGVRAMTASKRCRASIPLREIFPVLAQTLGVATRGSTLKLDLNMLFTPSAEIASSTALAPAFYIRNIATGTYVQTKPFVRYNKISLWIPRIKPSKLSEQKLSSQYAQGLSIPRFYEDYRYSSAKITANADIDQTYRLQTSASRPTRVIVALQKSNRMREFNRHPLQYDDLGLKQIELKINGVPFPSERYDTSRHLARILDDVYLAENKSYDVDSGSLITAESFLQGQHRVYVFDLSHTSASEFEAKNISDMEIHWVLNATVAQEYTVHALVVQQRQLKQTLLDGEVLITQN